MQAAGSDIDSFCGKCRLELAHVIVAAENGQAKRVQCKTCHSVHNHRSPSKASAPSRAVKARGQPSQTGRASRSRQNAENAFDEAVRGRDLTRPVRYKPSVALTSEAVVDHPSFGLGVVTRVLADGKASVLFADAERTLVHSRA